MEFFAVFAIDRPGGSEIRARVREAHRAHIRNLATRCRCVAGGPLMHDTDDDMIGTLLIFEAHTSADVAEVMAQDPYCLAGLFACIEVRRWQWNLGRPSAEPTVTTQGILSADSPPAG